ncbi:MFS transporter [Virgisporangium aliadipatigenens]|nr:MFS transporter [Virgisporangium aliadipatigenens]
MPDSDGAGGVATPGMATTDATTPVQTRPESPWAPLRNAVFRNLWIALLFSNVGTWMQTVGAQWLLVDEPNAATLVSIVQTATLLPALLLALPAGALADSFDRRGMLIVVQAYMLAVAVGLTVLTAFDQMPPALLLTLTFALGVGQTLTMPTWQALIPELIPRKQIPSASALGAISVNVARAVGPAIAGVLIARAGPEFVFGVNAASFLVFIVILLMWRPPQEEEHGTPERFTSALRAGGRYVRHSPVVRRILLRTALFVVPGSALWGLLPLVANTRLHLDAGGYGLMLGALGVGAVAGALIMPRVRQRLSTNQMLTLSGVLYAGSMTATATSTVTAVTLVLLIPAGVAWVAVLSSIGAAVQLFLPAWVRARGLAIYQVVFAGGQALGALAWGVLADVVHVDGALLVAAAVMAFGALTVRWLPLRDSRGMDRDPAEYWPEPELTEEPDPQDGPILVTADYVVLPEQRDEFVAAMRVVRRTKLRTGATRWGLFRQGEHENHYTEVYLVPSWDEHLRQHYGRLTGSDRAADEYAQSLAQGPANVTHLLPADPPH